MITETAINLPWKERLEAWKRFERAAYKKTLVYGNKESGDWKLEHQEVSEADAKWDMMQNAMHGSRRCTPKGTYTGIKHNGHLVMSNTPDEINDLRPLHDNATGNVLVNGLGLGCAVWGLLTMPQVKHVHVVEISSDVLSLVQPYFAGERVSFEHADAFTRPVAKGEKWGAVWHDIWPNLCTDDLQEHGKLKRKYARRTDWQQAWCQETLRYQRDRERRSGW